MSESPNIQEPVPLLPYATSSPQARHGDLFRDGATLIALNGITLPERCILCGRKGAGSPLRLKFSWDSSFQVTRKAALELRASGCVHAWLCADHLRRWRSGRIAGAIGMGASLLVMLASITVAVISESSDIPRYAPYAIAMLLAGFAAFIAFMFVFTLRTRTLRCRRIEQGYLYLEGACAAWLEGLQELPGKASGAAGRQP